MADAERLLHPRREVVRRGIHLVQVPAERRQRETDGLRDVELPQAAAGELGADETDVELPLRHRRSSLRWLLPQAGNSSDFDPCEKRKRRRGILTTPPGPSMRRSQRA